MVKTAPAASTDHAAHLLGLQGMPAAELRGLLGAAWRMDQRLRREPASCRDALSGRVVANLFFEDSTRTRTSFSVAAKRLGAEVVELIGSTSSVSKGETLIDTARNVASMGVAAVVTRTKQSGGAHGIARAFDTLGPACAVINAGDGRHEHPTQGLLDALTIAEALDRLESFDFTGLSVAIVGDVISSRVARSNVAALTTLGARVTLVGPPAMAPASLSALAPGVEVGHDLDAVLPRADAVMMLRIQFERAGEGNPAPGEMPRKLPAMASVREYRERYALTTERAGRLKPGAVVLHPGPINRGLELDQSVADGPASVILRQVALGVAVRAAALARCVLGREAF